MGGYCLQEKDLYGVCLFPGKDLCMVTGSREKISKALPVPGNRSMQGLLVTVNKSVCLAASLWPAVPTWLVSLRD